MTTRSSQANSRSSSSAKKIAAVSAIFHQSKHLARIYRLVNRRQRRMSIQSGRRSIL